MKLRRKIVLGLGVGAFAPRATLAQQARKIWRVGMLSVASKKFYVDAGWQSLFVQGMREHGYGEGKDFVLEERFADSSSLACPPW